jgi:hypothetical protein
MSVSLLPLIFNVLCREYVGADLSLPPYRHCDECLSGEVCVALNSEDVPTCRQPHDPSDPTGCGGHCHINTEFCRKLDIDAFR